MAQFLATLKLILSIVPAILELMTQLEKLFPAGGQGQAKLEIVKTTVQSLWTGATDAIPAFEDAWPKIQAIISGIVGVLNTFGIFKK